MGLGGGEGGEERRSGGEKMMMAMSSLFSDQQQNPIQQIQVKFKEVEVGVKTWLSKQSIPVEAAVVATMSGVQGAFIGGLMGTLSPEMPQTSNDPQAMASMKQAQALVGGPWVQARNFAAITGVNAGIACVMKRVRGKEDLESAVVAALGSGFAYSLVSQGLQGQPVNAITTAAGFAVFQGIFFKLGERFSKPSPEDPFYTRSRSMLLKLGLQKYEKNFKKGLLTDPTLPLLTDSALRDVSIPPGPRLLILDHIQRDPEIKGKRGK
ncbi:Mitochondrial import inner membrane translocase subunit Tim17/Tim22/Tim23 family protein [Raphanus sativus]|uniref:Chloroplastic import inner membrane translocase subunit HP30-1 n=1 Tax=Raphanus sativus TaxID=3726 RepID=A0A6J0JDZ7_RAPSA|nr:chloroplastic import inner membrane translocase subunit HP30-1 [Raphanus sativus]KAJ4890290.1 Mitochondrial import inner membrane translocase subunit Tim17/Tim22/Tim23 family protein [Raphanus sativus]